MELIKKYIYIQNVFKQTWFDLFQADLQSTLGDAGYIVFGVILFVWELLPTSLVVFFFRVRQPNLDRVSQQLSCTALQKLS